MKTAILAVLAMLGALSASSAQRLAEGAPSLSSRAAGPVTIPLHRYQGRLRTMRVVVGGHPHDFLFDTGGGLTFVSPAVADRARCVPAGRSVGFRMSGERLDTPLCTGTIPMELGAWHTAVAGAGVFDIMKLLPAGWPPLSGVISLHTFAGLAITMDLAHDRLVVETPASFAARVRKMTPLEGRLATGMDGAAVSLFVAARVGGGKLWLELDSGNLDVIQLAPYAARLLGVADVPADVTLRLAPSHAITSPARRHRTVIYDGVLSERAIAGDVYTMDLATGKLWVGRSASPG
jgi:hypothetical protein